MLKTNLMRDPVGFNMLVGYIYSSCMVGYLCSGGLDIYLVGYLYLSGPSYSGELILFCWAVLFI